MTFFLYYHIPFWSFCMSFLLLSIPSFLFYSTLSYLILSYLVLSYKTLPYSLLQLSILISFSLLYFLFLFSTLTLSFPLTLFSLFLLFFSFPLSSLLLFSLLPFHSLLFFSFPFFFTSLFFSFFTLCFLYFPLTLFDDQDYEAIVHAGLLILVNDKYSKNETAHDIITNLTENDGIEYDTVRSSAEFYASILW